MSQKIEVGQVYRYYKNEEIQVLYINGLVVTCISKMTGKPIQFTYGSFAIDGLTLVPELSQPTTAEILQKLVKDMAEYEIENEIDRYDAGRNDGINYCIDLINEQLKTM